MTIRRVAIIFDQGRRPETTGVYCREALAKLVHAEYFSPSHVGQIPETGFDLYLQIDDGLRNRLPEALHPRAWWAIDTHMDFAWCLDYARHFDYVFAAQRDGAAQLRDQGIDTASWLPLACDPSIHRPHEVPVEYDLCFVGNVLPGPRAELLELLQRRYRKMFIGQRYFVEMAKVFSASKIIFNRSVKNDVNMRVFEAVACGGLLLTNDLADNGQAELFRDGQHLTTYGDADELLEKVEYYRHREDLYRRIGEAGRQEAIARHTYEHRMRDLLERVESSLSRMSVRVTEPPPANSNDTDGDLSYYDFARPELLELVPTTANRVLDIGCGTGRLGQSLKARQPRHVVGIELDPRAAAVAKTRIDEALSVDVESAELEFEAGALDAVVCGDVLEHLWDPLALMRRIRDWLAPEGRLIASVPNARHQSVVASLLEGNWTYEPAGILDETHRHFFTRLELERLLDRAGYTISRLAFVPGPGFDAWQHQGRPGRVRLGRWEYHAASPADAEEFFAYQFLVVAQPVPAPHSGMTSTVSANSHELAGSTLP